jgi:hypothetical protein
MDITVYLPDEVGERMKRVGLRPSALLRGAVIGMMDQLAEEAEGFYGAYADAVVEPAVPWSDLPEGARIPWYAVAAHARDAL